VDKCEDLRDFEQGIPVFPENLLQNSPNPATSFSVEDLKAQLKEKVSKWDNSEEFRTLRRMVQHLDHAENLVRDESH